jgi:hypothetical protein
MPVTEAKQMISRKQHLAEKENMNHVLQTRTRMTAIQPEHMVYRYVM